MQTDKWDEWQEGWNDAAQSSIDGRAWSPSAVERAEDFGVREELGLPRDRRQEDWNRDAWTEFNDSASSRASLGPSPSPSPEVWVPSDRECAEDSAAWDALVGSRVPTAGGSSPGGTLQQMTVTMNFSDAKDRTCVIC